MTRKEPPPKPTDNWLGPKRQPGESFEDYKKRRAKENAQGAKICRGAPRWLSRRQGTYVRPKSEPDKEG
jgi:hypothetical protein